MVRIVTRIVVRIVVRIAAGVAAVSAVAYQLGSVGTPGFGQLFREPADDLVVKKPLHGRADDVHLRAACANQRFFSCGRSRVSIASNLGQFHPREFNHIVVFRCRKR